MFCDWWLNFETLYITCHEFLTQPTKFLHLKYFWMICLVTHFDTGWKKQLEWGSAISSNQRDAHGPIFWKGFLMQLLERVTIVSGESNTKFEVLLKNGIWVTFLHFIWLFSFHLVLGSISQSACAGYDSGVYYLYIWCVSVQQVVICEQKLIPKHHNLMSLCCWCDWVDITIYIWWSMERVWVTVLCHNTTMDPKFALCICMFCPKSLHALCEKHYLPEQYESDKGWLRFQ